MKRSELIPQDSYSATYEPESDKIRLYVGRVPREEFEFLRAEGWVSTPKQECDFAAVWTPSRYATAIHLAGEVGDEDTPPTERAADRAERFSGYLDNRMADAGMHADNYAACGQIGFQSQARAERAEKSLDRQADKAGDNWSKAEYWQRRTAGVISHALHKSSPEVRMGRIKVLEADLRKRQKDQVEWIAEWERTVEIAADPAPWVARIMERYDKTQQEAEKDVAEVVLGSCAKLAHPRNGNPEKKYIFELIKDPDPVTLADFCAIWQAKYPMRPSDETQWSQHLKLRLAYERQMLEAQGGRAAMVDMEAGGWVGKHQIRKVNKSNVTGRVVSVGIMYPTRGRDRWGNDDPTAPEFRMEIINVERLEKDIYTPPTDAERAEFQSQEKAAKKAKAAAAKEKAAKGENCPLINPTDEDAERLQDAINERHADEWRRHHGTPTEHYKPKKGSVQRITQAVYSANSTGSYAKAETRGLCADMQLEDRSSNMWSSAANERQRLRGPALCKIRITGYDPVSIIVITDKPQKPLLATCWEVRKTEQLATA